MKETTRQFFKKGRYVLLSTYLMSSEEMSFIALPLSIYSSIH